MDSRLVHVFCRIYAAMLYAYPREFRLQYGPAMEQVFRDRCREVARVGNARSWLSFSIHNAVDWIASTVRERRATSQNVSGSRKLIQEWAVTLLLFLFVTTTMVQAYVVPTGSMENNIMVGDHMFVDKVGFPNGGNNWASYVLPQRTVKLGDIVAFRYPEDVRQTFVKRVLGVPGDHIRLVDKQVIRNGQKLDEPYVQHSSSAIDDYRDNFPTAPDSFTLGGGRDMFSRNVHDREVIVPPGMLFMMGDNRDNSLDSRYWGFLPSSYVVGKPLFIYWSYDAPTDDLATWNFAHMEDVALHFFTKTRWDRTLKVPRSQAAQ
jgi:signal peptidase I